MDLWPSPTECHLQAIHGQEQLLSVPLTLRQKLLSFCQLGTCGYGASPWPSNLVHIVCEVLCMAGGEWTLILKPRTFHIISSLLQFAYKTGPWKPIISGILKPNFDPSSWRSNSSTEFNGVQRAPICSSSPPRSSSCCCSCTRRFFSSSVSRWAKAATSLRETGTGCFAPLENFVDILLENTCSVLLCIVMYCYVLLCHVNLLGMVDTWIIVDHWIIITSCQAWLSSHDLACREIQLIRFHKFKYAIIQPLQHSVALILLPPEHVIIRKSFFLGNFRVWIQRVNDTTGSSQLCPSTCDFFAALRAISTASETAQNDEFPMECQIDPCTQESAPS